MYEIYLKFDLIVSSLTSTLRGKGQAVSINFVVNAYPKLIFGIKFLAKAIFYLSEEIYFKSTWYQKKIQSEIAALKSKLDIDFVFPS